MTSKLIVILVCALTLVACGDSKKKSQQTIVYDLVVTNITAGQPLSPPAVVLHDASYSGWQLGEMASLGLEMLAEGGDPSSFIAEAGDVHDSDYGDGILPPGESVAFTLQANADAAVMLTVLAMPVNTNDAFSGVTALDLMHLMPGESKHWLTPIYDAGTENNSEMAGHIPGPAGMGEGFNSDRDDVNYVAYHPGVVTSSDGLTESALDVTHKFDQGGLRLMVTRRQ